MKLKFDLLDLLQHRYLAAGAHSFRMPRRISGALTGLRSKRLSSHSFHGHGWGQGSRSSYDRWGPMPWPPLW